MQHNLTERQVELVQWIAAEVKNGYLDETFHVVWDTGLSEGQRPILVWGEGEWIEARFTYGDFNALAEDGFLRMKHDGRYAFPMGVKGYALTDKHYACTVTKRLLEVGSTTTRQVTAENATGALEVFISHHNSDADLAETLIDLIRAALNLEHERIRCTSVDGYRLPAGASTDDQLKREVRDSKCFIALLTPRSLQSAYVLFELGARWGAQLSFLPLLARGMVAKSLPGPLSGLNALTCSSSSQTYQLVGDLAKALGRRANRPDTYDKFVPRLLLASVRPSNSENQEAANADPAESSALKSVPPSQAATEVPELIRRESDSQKRGLVEIQSEIEPGQTLFFPRLQYAGIPNTSKSRIFAEVVEELIAHQWLYPPEDNESTGTRTYEYRPKAEE